MNCSSSYQSKITSDLLAAIRQSDGDCNVVSVQDKAIAGYWLVKSAMDVAIPRGANSNKLLRGTGIFEDAITPHMMISIKQYCALLSNVKHYAKGKDTGFLIGSAIAAHWARSPLHVLQSCDDANAVITHLFYHQQFRWCALPLFNLREYDNGEALILVPEYSGINSKLTAFALEIAFSTVVSLLKSIVGQRAPVSFTFTSGRPRHIADFETHLGMKVQFNHQLNSIVLDKTYLSQKVNAISLKNTNKHAAFLKPDETSVELVQGISLLDYIRHSVFLKANLGLPDVASCLGWSAATLKRKLKEHDTSYRALSEEVKRNQAIVLLSLQKLSNEQTANQMAMSDLPNFRRVVKRLTGNTPSELRAIALSNL